MRPADAPLLGGMLSTDRYQLAMADVYWQEGLADLGSRFDHFFRRLPNYGTHQAGYGVLAGIDWFLDWLERVRVTDADLAYLASRVGPGGEPLHHPGFLDWLAEVGDFSALTVVGVEEGRVVHPNTPLLTVEGPLALVQLVETPLLNALNYPTLVATKASRVVEAAAGRPVLEFGLRRGPEAGADAGSRAALIGGCSSTSNVALAGSVGVEPAGTIAHSFIQAYLALGQGEVDAFRAYARAHPDGCVLLVDTIDTLASGVPNAITVFTELVASGHRPGGIRLDSGDLAHLAVRSARLLVDAGLDDVPIVLSSDLDELVIWQIRSQVRDEAPSWGLDPDAVLGRLAYGVGTRLITSEGDPSPTGVFKLVALDGPDGWAPAIKVSEDAAKVPAPGRKRLVRLYDERGRATADVVALADEPLERDEWELVHPFRETGRSLPSGAVSAVEDLQVPLFAEGRRVSEPLPVADLRERRRQDVGRLDTGVRRLVNPHRYHVSYTRPLLALRDRLVAEARG